MNTGRNRDILALPVQELGSGGCRFSFAGTGVPWGGEQPMCVRIGIGLVMVGLLSACAAVRTGPGTLFGPERYERHTRRGPHLQLHWNLSRTEHGVGAEGYAENVGDSLTRLRWIRLQLVGYDAQGRVVVRSRSVPSRPDVLLTPDNPTFPLPREIYATFRIHLRDPNGAVRFEVVGDYSFDTFPQGEGDEPSKSGRPGLILRTRRAGLVPPVRGYAPSHVLWNRPHPRTASEASWGHAA